MRSWGMRHPRDLNLAGLEVNDEEDKVVNEAMGSENLDAHCEFMRDPIFVQDGMWWRHHPQITNNHLSSAPVLIHAEQHRKIECHLPSL